MNRTAVSPFSALVLTPGAVDSAVEDGLEAFELVDLGLVEGVDVFVVAACFGISQFSDASSDAIVPLLASLCVGIWGFPVKFLDVKIQKLLC
jgi:hypothetical protein